MKTILFTGSRGGIINKVLNNVINDYKIYLTVHTNKELEIVKKKYKNVICLKLDVTNKEDIKKIEDLDIDILVSNAAIGESGSIADIPVSKIKENFETNVFSNVEVIQTVLKNMIKKGKGKIIVMSSLAGIVPIPFLGPYCSSKAALTKLIECLRKEMKILNKNIKIYLIEPGFYKTGFNTLMMDKKYEYMEYKSYFKYHIDSIQKYENSMLAILEKKSLHSVTKKIEHVINHDSIKFKHKVPFIQAVMSKVYQIIN